MMVMADAFFHILAYVITQPIVGQQPLPKRQPQLEINTLDLEMKKPLKYEEKHLF